MKSVFRTIFNGNSLTSKKKLILAAVLSSVAINCEATQQKIDNNGRESNVFNGERLENLCWQEVSTHLKTPEDFKRFKMISKKCARVVNGLRFNPISITDDMNDELVHNLFPNLETQFLYSLSDRVIDMGNKYNTKISGYDVKYTVINRYFHTSSPLFSGLYCIGSYDIIKAYIADLCKKNIKFSRKINCGYRNYVSYKTLVDNLYLNESYIHILNKLREVMRQFVVGISFECWKKLDKKDKAGLITQKKDKNIKDVKIYWLPWAWSEIESYMNGQTLTVPRGVNCLNLGYITKDLTQENNIRNIRYIHISNSVKIIDLSCFCGYKNLTEITFESADIVFEGKNTFLDCKSLGIIYVINVRARDLESFKQNLVRAGLNENVEVICIEN